MKRRKNSKFLIIKRDKFLDLLKKIGIGGIINEFVFELNGKYICVDAIDLTESVTVKTKIKVFKGKVKNTKLGISNISILEKFLKSISDIELQIKLDGKRRMVISRKDKKRKLEFLLSYPDAIPTTLEEDEETGNIKKYQCYSTELNTQFAKDLLAYIGMSESKQLTVEYKNGNILFICGNKNESRTKLEMDSEINSINDVGDITLSYNGEFLSKILSIIDFTNDSLPTLYIGEDAPMLIEHEDTIWTLSPLLSEGIEDE